MFSTTIMSLKRGYSSYISPTPTSSSDPPNLELNLTGSGEETQTSEDTPPLQKKQSITKPFPVACDSCRKIDFKSVLKTNVRGKRIFNGPVICNLDHINKISDCYVCQFFRDMRIKPPRGHKSDFSFKLVVFSALAQLHFAGLDIEDSVMLAVVGKSISNSLSTNDRDGYSLGPYIMSPNPPRRRDTTAPIIRARALNHQAIQCSVLVEWVDFCRQNHPEDCPTHEIHSIDGFRVIDCEMRQVILAPELCEYVALSYVWGAMQTKAVLEHNILPDATHPVIEDAIVVTQRLGFRYLWVDRYCIIYKNVHETQRQIGSMDSIYRESALTIIAATDDPQNGLPGVGSTHRLRQPSIDVGGLLLVSTLPDPKEIIRQSKWNTRAWTFQEGLLSRKRLVFTNHDVYFQCGCKHFRESISLPLDPFRPQHKNGGHRRRQGERYQVFPPNSPGNEPADLMNRIQEYSQKRLSFDSDGLNAMLGIFKTFEKTPIRIWHLQGIPLYDGDPRNQLPPDHLYFTDQGLGKALTWTVTGEARRNLKLPSWSWVGWTGFTRFCPDTGIRYQGGRFARKMDMHFFVPPNNINPCDKRQIIKIKVELKSGDIVKWEDLQYTVPYCDWTESLSNVLQLEAWTFDVDLCWDHKSQKWNLNESLKSNSAHRELFEKHNNERSYEHLLDDRLLGVIVEMDYKPAEQPAIAFLLLRFVKELDLWERVECFKIRAGRDWKENWPNEGWYGKTRLFRRTLRLG